MRPEIRLAAALSLVPIACNGGGTGTTMVDGGAPPVTPGLTAYVDPVIGSATFDGRADNTFNGGDIFPGAVFPFGLVQFSPDTTNAAGGYRFSQNTINGFSLTHFSGRGVSCWQDIGFMPTVGPLTASPGATRVTSTFDHASEAASPGFYRVLLQANGIDVQLTATARTGFARFAFPATDAATVVIDAGHSAQRTQAAGTGVTIMSPTMVTGSVQSGGCGGAFTYRVYFAAEFDRPATASGTWVDAQLMPGAGAAAGARSGAYLTFDARSQTALQVRVGISFVSVDNALANLRAESSGWDFSSVRNAAVTAWNSRLGSIEVEGGTEAERKVFYTGLYHTMIHPNLFSDVNGQYLGFDNQVHTVAPGHLFYENYAAWDNYRSLIPLQAIIAPQEASDIMQALVTMSQQDSGGGLPRWQQANGNSGGMVGDGPLPGIASAYALGVRGFDTQAALAAMERNASNPATRSGGHAVREGLADYLDRGYVAGAASVTLEYQTADFALGQFAGALGDEARRKLYVDRAGRWRTMYDTASGYLLPRDAMGIFPADFTPTMTRGFTEGTASQYLWMVPHDIVGLADAMGGREAAIQRLDAFFTQLNAGIRSENAFIGNEPGQNAPWAFDFLGVPSHTATVVRRAVRELFTTEPRGMPGNDDGGATSAWLVFACLGIYPGVPGVGGVLVGSPLFPAVNVHLAGGKVLRIEATGGGMDSAFVQSLTIDGAPHTSPWIPWSRLQGGARLSFELGSTPSPTWGTRPEDAPPRFDAN
jgi:predicted alpha-1,2-mannosidase